MDGVAAPALICAEARPRVLLLDGMMPHAGGAKTLRQVGELPEDARRGTAIVFMAAGNDPPASDIAGRIQRHALATVAKPFDLDALLAAVERGAIQLARRPEKG